MKKIKFIIPAVLLTIFICLAFLPQNTILGGKDFINDMLIKMFIAIVLIFAYLIARFYKKGAIKITINGLAIPVIAELCIFIVSLFSKGNIYGNPLSFVLLLLSFAIYFVLYIRELEK